MPVYTATFGQNAVTATGDLLEVRAAAGKRITLLSAQVGQKSDAGNAEAEMLQVTVKRVASGDQGTGGTTLTPIPHESGGAASTSTVLGGNTTDATPIANTGWGESFNSQAGLFYTPTPREWMTAEGQESLVLKLDVESPDDAIDLVARMTWEEETI